MPAVVAEMTCRDEVGPHPGTKNADKDIILCVVGCTAAAGVSAQSPIAGQVLAAKQGMRRKSRLQHVTAADDADAASPSGAPQQATPNSAAATRAAAHQQRQGQPPQGVGQPGAGDDGSQTPGAGKGSTYMTPPTGSVQRPAVGRG